MIPKFGKYTEEHLAAAIKMCRSDPEYNAFKEQSYQQSQNKRNLSNNKYLNDDKLKIKSEPEFGEFITICDKLRQKGYNIRLSLSQSNFYDDNIVVSDFQELPGKYIVKIRQDFLQPVTSPVTTGLERNTGLILQTPTTDPSTDPEIVRSFDLLKEFHQRTKNEERENNRKWYGGRVFLLQTITEDKIYKSLDEIADDVIFYRDFLIEFYRKTYQIDITDKFSDYSKLFYIDVDKSDNTIRKGYDDNMRMEIVVTFADIVKIQ
jgi:hypothetical protein